MDQRAEQASAIKNRLTAHAHFLTAAENRPRRPFLAAHKHAPEHRPDYLAISRLHDGARCVTYQQGTFVHGDYRVTRQPLRLEKSLPKRPLVQGEVMEKTLLDLPGDAFGQRHHVGARVLSSGRQVDHAHDLT